MSGSPSPSSDKACGDPPLHVAIIMDGNGRWARERGLPRTMGHKKGAEAVRRTIKASVALGVTHLTLFAFSTENWKRPEEEVSTLMDLLRFYLRSEIAKLHQEGVQLRCIGERGKLSPDLQKLIEDAENLTTGNDRLVLTVALSYGSRSEIVQAAKKLGRDVKSGRLDPDQIDEQLLGENLWTDGLPDPDLLIRTSGEQRISNFLLWQMAYAELYFTDVYWPDFDKVHLQEALGELGGRERRFGMIRA